MTNTEYLLKVNNSKNSGSMMEDRTRSAEARRPHLVHEHSIMMSSDKSIGEKKVSIGIRAMSAQERSSLSLKYKVEEDAKRLSEKKSKIVKGRSTYL